MATNKHAIIRYHALDRCFSNFGRKYYIEDLVEACNEAIYEFTGIEEGVRRRQVFDDIAFMESEQGWEIPLERIRDGRRVYYRYTDPSFSIKDQGINQSEAEQLKETLSILSRFKGMPQFEWVEEMMVRLEDTFKLKGDFNKAVDFEENPYLKGLNLFSDLFQAIQDQQPLIIKYQSFRQEKPSDITFHPWYLKQYNNRWFLFGFNQDFGSISNLAVDRIGSFQESKEKFRPNTEVDFEEFFEDVIGVSVKVDAPLQRVVIRVNAQTWPYIDSKPLHGSQKVIKKHDEGVDIELSLKVNHEFYALLFSYMDGVEILEPQTVRSNFKGISESILKKYS